MAEPLSACSAACRLRLLSSSTSPSRRSSCSRRLRSSTSSVLYAGSLLACCSWKKSWIACFTIVCTSVSSITASFPITAAPAGRAMPGLFPSLTSFLLVDFTRNLGLDLLPHIRQKFECQLLIYLLLQRFRFDPHVQQLSCVIQFITEIG